MKINIFAAMMEIGVILAVTAGCTAASPTPTASPAAAPTQFSPILSSSPILTPSDTLAPTLTLPPSATSTVTLPPTTTPTPTLSPTPSRTPTRTPVYNRTGLYPVGRCVQFGFTYGDPAPGGTGVVSMCIVTVQVNKDRSMQFNMLWHLVSATGNTPSRYVYGNIDAVYLTDEFGNHYDPLVNSGKAPDRDENHDGTDSTSGWYLFPASNRNAHLFTFHDDDGKTVSIGNLEFITY